jgi:uncharacterized RDD family membrane protein YckC
LPPPETEPYRMQRCNSPGLPRRLAAVIYDAMLLFSVLFFATLPVLLLTSGHAVPPANPVLRLYLVAVAFLYFAWPWTHGGQTLGMRAWRLRVVQVDGSPITWAQATRRFGASLLSWAPLGAGFLWVLVDPERLAWHDRLSGTRLELTPR